MTPASWYSQGVIIPLRALLMSIRLGAFLFRDHRAVERLLGDQGMILEIISVAEKNNITWLWYPMLGFNEGGQGAGLAQKQSCRCLQSLWLLAFFLKTPPTTEEGPCQLWHSRIVVGIIIISCETLEWLSKQCPGFKLTSSAAVQTSFPFEHSLG